VLSPHARSFAAVGTDIYFFPSFQQLGAEGTVNGAFPDFAEALLFEIAHAVRGVFVKTTRSHQAIPCNNRIMPEAPAMVGELSFEFVALAGFAIPAESVEGRD